MHAVECYGIEFHHPFDCNRTEAAVGFTSDIAPTEATIIRHIFVAQMKTASN